VGRVGQPPPTYPPSPQVSLLRGGRSGFGPRLGGGNLNPPRGPPPNLILRNSAAAQGHKNRCGRSLSIFSRSSVPLRGLAPQHSVWRPSASKSVPEQARMSRSYESSFKTLIAFSRKNFGQTLSLNGTSGISEKIRSSDKPIGKYPA